MQDRLSLQSTRCAFVQAEQPNELPQPSKVASDLGDGAVQSSVASTSVSRRIFGATARVAMVTCGVMAANAARDVIAAAIFGLSDAVDTFAVGWLLYTFVTSVVGGSFLSSLVPAFILIRQQEGLAAADLLLTRAITMAAGLLVGIAVVLAVSGPWVLTVLGAGFGEQKLTLAYELLLILLPAVVLSGLGAVLGAVLNACDRFAIVPAAAAVIPLVAICAIVFFGRAMGIHVLAIGTLIGSLLQFLLLVWALRWQGFLRSLSTPMTKTIHSAMRRVVGQYWPMVCGAALMSGTILIDQAVASRQGAGSIAALTYGAKVTAMVLSVATTAMGSAVLPHFSTMVASCQWREIRRTVWTLATVLFAFTVPLTLLLYLCSDIIVMVLFERGAFTPSDTAIVSDIQRMYFLQIPFYAVGVLLARLISSLMANGMLLWIAVASLLVTIILDVLLVELMGIPGIALSTSIVFAFSSVVMMCVLALRLRQVTTPTTAEKERKS